MKKVFFLIAFALSISAYASSYFTEANKATSVFNDSDSASLEKDLVISYDSVADLDFSFEKENIVKYDTCLTESYLCVPFKLRLKVAYIERQENLAELYIYQNVKPPLLSLNLNTYNKLNSHFVKLSHAKQRYRYKMNC